MSQPDQLDQRDFNRLSAEAYAEGSTIEQKTALWRAVFQLKEWHFIARGQFPDVTPYVARNASIANGESLVKAFTDVPKLQAFAKANGLTDEKGEVLFLAMPVPGFMETLRNYQELGVFGIHFNADARDAGFYASLPQLAGIRDFVCKNG